MGMIFKCVMKRIKFCEKVPSDYKHMYAELIRRATQHVQTLNRHLDIKNEYIPVTFAMSTKLKLRSFWGSAKKTVLGLTPLSLHTTQCHVTVSESTPSLQQSFTNPPPHTPRCSHTNVVQWRSYHNRTRLGYQTRDSCTQ